MSKTRHRDSTFRSQHDATLQALLERAVALHQRGQLAQAKPLYLEIIRQAPTRGDVANYLGFLALQQHEFEEAAMRLRQVVALDPRNAPAYSNLGYALRVLKRHEEAVASCDRALELAPGFVDALCNRAAALADLQRWPEALASYDYALALAPSLPQAHRNRGDALLALGRPMDALTAYGRALALDPNDVDAQYNRGAALRALGRHQEALAAYERVLALKPDSVEASRNRGIALCELGRYEDAVGEFDRLLRRDQNVDFVPGDRLNAKLQCCDWRDLDAELMAIRQDIAAGKRVVTPFAFLSMADAPVEQHDCAKLYADIMAPAGPAMSSSMAVRPGRIRLAYLSADFRDHAVAHQIVGVIEAHDRERFETVGLAFGLDSQDAMRHRLSKAFDRFIDLRGKSDRDAAQLLRALEIDIAIDLTGYTAGCRPGILAQRAAPVQVNYLGYPGTMGGGAIDYIIADRIVIPDALAACYSEKITALPDSFLPCDTGRRIAARTPSRAEAGLPETGFVFCAFNNAYKISPAMFEIWLRLLNQVEGSVLWLSIGNLAARRNLRRAAESGGVAGERLVFAPRLPQIEDHLARHRLADLMLDSLPYNAHTTAADALWAGLPLVTCLGQGFAGRVAGSLLHAVGLPELVTETPAEYEALALALARDPARLAALRARLDDNRKTAPLFDTARYCRHLERAYTAMQQRAARGEKPESFAVSPL